MGSLLPEGLGDDGDRALLTGRPRGSDDNAVAQRGGEEDDRPAAVAGGPGRPLVAEPDRAGAGCGVDADGAGSGGQVVRHRCGLIAVCQQSDGGEQVRLAGAGLPHQSGDGPDA